MAGSNGEAFRVRVRPIAGSESASFSGTDPAIVLAAVVAAEQDEETVVFWDDDDELCAVDVDGCDYDDAKLLVFLSSFQPQPFLAWTTHGRGLRLVYVASDPCTAKEVSAVAALNVLSSVRCDSVELKRETRHPKCVDARGRTCGTVVHRQQEFDVRSLKRRLGVLEASDSQVQKWLESRNMAVGGRYEHSACPVGPSDRGGRRPVVVLDSGVHCFVCEAGGVCAGSSKPGFFPYAHLCGERRTSVFYRMLENATHWEHARHFFDDRQDLARLLYSAGVAMLRCRTDASAVFVAGRDLVRIGDRWTNTSGEPYVKDVRPLLSTLPACTYRSEDGRVKIDRSRVVVFEQTFDLSKYGYSSLTPVFGCRMWPELRPATAVVQVRELASEDASGFRPKYVSAESRMSESDMWREFESCFPSLCRPLVELLVVARGISEGEQSMPPMVFVTGPTGASKSLSVFIAASVCGDRNTEVVWTSNSDRVRQAVVDAGSAGAFVTFNEVLKEARRQLGKRSQAMDYVLNLTPDSVSHYMYVGPVRMGRLPVFVWTDTALPDSVQRDAQLARRIVHVKLSKSVDWEASMRDSGVGHPKRFRVSSERRARAADALLSRVIDRFLRPPMAFGDAATVLGFERMSEGDEAESFRDALANLFECVCSAPDVAGADAMRWKGRGWKLVNRDVDAPLQQAWLAVADEDSFGESHAASEVDWQRVAGLREPARLETRQHGNRVVLRFKSVDSNRSVYRVNGELR